jgi:hypothetical protein
MAEPLHANSTLKHNPRLRMLCEKAPAMILLLLFLVIPVSFLQAQTQSVTFTTSGTWIVPAGVTEIAVEVWGAGGRGGTRTSSGGTGGGGGAGAYSKSIITVNQGSYNFVVGTGSSLGTSPGGDTWFGTNTTLMAKGGNSVADQSGTGASGGSATNGYGDQKINGGNGNNNGTGGNSPNGGDGGEHETGNNPGNPGNPPGGGGGGAHKQGGGGGGIGGKGGDGRIVITYEVASCTNATLTLSSGSASQSVCAGTAISDIVYTYGGGATGVNVTNLPAGLISSMNAGNQTITISGTPTAIGTFNYTVTTTGTLDSCEEDEATGTITVNENLAVSVSIDASPSGSVCAGTEVTFTVTPTNGGANPGYQWQVNGIDAGTNSTSFSYTPDDGDVITCILTSDATCTTGGATIPVTTFSWNDDSKYITDSDYGLNVIAIGGGVYMAGGVGGTLALGPVTSPKTDIDLNFGDQPEFNTDGVDYSISYRRAESVGQLFYRGNSLIISGGNTFNVSYRLDDGSGSYITVTSSNFTINQDGSFHDYRFIYNPSDGVGRLYIDNSEVWTSSPTPGQSMYWTGSGDLMVGRQIDASGNAIPTFDNLSIKGIRLNTAFDEKTVTVNPDNTITLTSATGTDNQTVNIETNITTITYTTTGATGADFSGLPAGISGNWAANEVTISGTPTETGTFNYTVELTGGCGTVTATGTINVNNTFDVFTESPGQICNAADGQINYTETDVATPITFTVDMTTGNTDWSPNWEITFTLTPGPGASIGNITTSAGSFTTPGPYRITNIPSVDGEGSVDITLEVAGDIYSDLTVLFEITTAKELQHDTPDKDNDDRAATQTVLAIPDTGEITTN